MPPYRTITDNKLAVLEAVQKHPGQNVSTYAAILNQNHASVGRILNEMYALKQVRYKTKKKNRNLGRTWYR